MRFVYNASMSFRPPQGSPNAKRGRTHADKSGVPTIELRASIVIGSGSASFETIRSLVERLPAIVAPPRL